MRRADRLFQIIQFLRTRRITTAQWLADTLEVSSRTIYRDIQDLISSGVPIDGEAGVGYVLHKDYDLPPLMFDTNELSALVLGTRIVATLGGNMQQHAERALSKLNSALPKTQQQKIEQIKLYAPFINKIEYGMMIDCINQAILTKRILHIAYQKPQDSAPEPRAIYPLGVFFWEGKWTMAAWCQLRDDFRHFRLDRIHHYALDEASFTLERKQTLEAFFAMVQHHTKTKS